MQKYDVIIIGAGLAGLTSAYYLSKNGKGILLIEKEKFLGGRTSSWNDLGMDIESGFHRHIGYYKELPKLLNEVGVNINDIVIWEKELEIKISKENSIILGIDPIHAPIKFLKGITGNRDIISLKDKMSLAKLFLLGFKDYTFHTKTLDSYSILEYAEKKKITENIIQNMITPLSTGIFFQEKENYSSKLFFGIFYPSLFRIINIRIGAYKMGMSEALANPIAKAIQKNGGTIITNSKVASLLYQNQKVMGVKLENGKEIVANQTILAADIRNAKEIVTNLKNNSFICKLLDTSTTSAITVQLELKKRALNIDRATFSPHTILASFTEESHTTFPNSKGRLSIILANPDQLIEKSNKEILNLVIKDFKTLGMDIENNITNVRIVRHKDKFYNLRPNHDNERLPQETTIPGLTLAGDYTRQKFYSTMEGAVISGILAYQQIIKQKD